MTTSALSSKGQTTIPKEIRDFLNLKTGDRIDFLIQDPGLVLLKPANTHIHDLKGLLHRTGQKKVSVQKMNEAIQNRFKKVL